MWEIVIELERLTNRIVLPLLLPLVYGAEKDIPKFRSSRYDN
jgi:hypothetical protein